MDYNLGYLNKRMLFLIFAVAGISSLIPLVGILPGFTENFAYSAIQVSPFMLLALCAYLSGRYPCLKIFTTIWLLAVIFMTAVASFGIGAISVLPAGYLDGEEQGADFSVTDEIGISTVSLITGLFFSTVAACIISLAGQIRAFRVFLSHYIPIDPDSFVHKTALTAILAITIIPLLPLLITGIPPYLSPVLLEGAHSAEMIAEAVSFDIFTLFWMILASLVIAGLYINRSFPDVLKRLGLAKPSGAEFLHAVAAGIILVGIFFVIDHAITAVWEFFGLNITDEEAVNTLFAAYLTPAAALVAAVSAGFGEEITVRGLMQPRFGIIIPSLLFASLHAFQYNWDGVLMVFIAGIIFAHIRERYNTTFSAVTHTVYDLILFGAIILGIGI